MNNMDRKVAVKSAPAMGRKTSEKKTSSLREIEIWVNADHKEMGSRTSARNVGHLTENITEDIMLHARQCELGRERYKFLVNHAYERQKFIEHQNKKEKSMKKQMQAARRSIAKITPLSETKRRSLTVRIPRVFQTETPADGHDEPDGYKREDTLTPKPPENEGTSAKEINIVLNSSAEKEIHLPKTINIDKKQTKATYLKTGLKSANKDPKSARDSSKLPDVKPAVCKGVSFGERPGSIKSIKSEKTSATRPLSRTASSTKFVGQKMNPSESTIINLAPRKASVDITDGQISTWASKSPYARMRTYGQRFVSSIDDPRYVALQSTLTPHITVGIPKREVKDIIARKDALRGRSSCETDYRKRCHAKFIAQILQRELSATM